MAELGHAHTLETQLNVFADFHPKLTEEQRREAIVDNAAKLFATTGFRGASVSDLATACNISKSLIYHYYPSKEDILYAVMASHIDVLRDDLEEILAGEREPYSRLHAIVHRFMRLYAGAADRQKVLLNELDRLPESKRQAIIVKQRAIVGAVADIFVELEPSLKSNPNKARAKAMLFFGMINWTHIWFDPAGPISPDQLADMALEMALQDGGKRMGA